MNKHWISIPVAALMSIGGMPGRAADQAPPVIPSELARQSGCFECHGVDKIVIGPAYQDVAARYKGDAKAREWLIEKVKKGGKGNWTEVTRGVLMPPHSPRLSDEKIASLVNWILSLEPEKK